MRPPNANRNCNLLRPLFLIAIAATIGSLYFGEVLEYPPCTLCWYQRICMYPLVMIFGTALWTMDEEYLKYSFPLSLIGLGISAYHNLLYYGVIPEGITPCMKGVSCTTVQVELFGLLTIPLMSLVSFIAINALSVWALRNRKLGEI